MTRPDEKTLIRLLKDDPDKRYNVAGICRKAGVSVDVVKNKLIGRYGRLSDDDLDRIWEAVPDKKSICSPKSLD